MSGMLVISPAASPDGALYLAVNSSRQAGECQPVVVLPAVDHDPTTKVNCTYISIPQATRRFGVLLSKPWWAWGGEMGANDQGVVAGTRPVLSRDQEREPGLIGMDLLRVGLERGGRAREALDIITYHLQTYGQGGSQDARPDSPGYDSIFLIADVRESWLLETAGRHWVAREVKRGTAITSHYTITSNFDRHSYALAQYVQNRGWWGREEIDFNRIFSRLLRTYENGSVRRRQEILSKVASLKTEYPLLGLMRLLRYHRGRYPRRTRSRDLVLHAGRLCGPRWHTNGSMVARVASKRLDVFFTGTPSTDLAIFKPVHFDLPLDPEPTADDLAGFSENSLWWRQERMYRFMRMSAVIPAYHEERDQLEEEMVRSLLGARGEELPRLRRELQERLLAWEQEWYEQITDRKLPLVTLRPFSRYWRRRCRTDRVPL